MVAMCLCKQFAQYFMKLTTNLTFFDDYPKLILVKSIQLLAKRAFMCSYDGNGTSAYNNNQGNVSFT